MPKITQIKALEILDSRGNPTIEIKVESGELSGRACVPSGASTGTHEAVELRDKNNKRYQGKGVFKAVENVNKIIAPKLKGVEIVQSKIDQILIDLDGTENKSRLGANATLGVSLACVRLAAKIQDKPLYQYIGEKYKFKIITAPAGSRCCGTNPKQIQNPKSKIQNYQLPCPMFNLINGGKHADSGLDIQEFMVAPLGIKKYSEQLRAGSEIYQVLKKILQQRDLRIAVGDEGGFAPKLKNSQAVFKILLEAVKRAGYCPGRDVFLAIDAAASEFLVTNKKLIKNESKANKYKFEKKIRYIGEMIDIYQKWIKKYPLISIEDPLAEDDWVGWGMMNQESKKARKQESKKTKKQENIILIGDDLFTTNVERLAKGIKLGVANAVLIKPNQIGTLSETIDCIKLAQKNNYKIIISHRSGETGDPFIADLAVACGADFIKAGAPCRGERVAKYNRLLEIENGF